MRLLSESSFSKLEQRQSARDAEIAQMIERNQRLSKRCRELEANYQTLVLRVGLKGYTVEFQPEIPAKPATLVLKANK